MSGTVYTEKGNDWIGEYREWFKREYDVLTYIHISTNKGGLTCNFRYFNSREVGRL